jgi:hypothetical protein
MKTHKISPSSATQIRKNLGISKFEANKTLVDAIIYQSDKLSRMTKRGEPTLIMYCGVRFGKLTSLINYLNKQSKVKKCLK